MEREISFVPFADEAALARLSYDRWEQAQAESLADYTYRRRTVDLASLLHKAIGETLTEKQQMLIRMRYYENRTPTEIANRTGLHPSTVLHTLKTAEQKLRDALRYVVEYQNGTQDDTLLPADVRRAMVVSAARHMQPDTFARRLYALRVGENLALPVLSQSVQIPEARVAALENGDTEPNAGELLRLSAFFGVSVDALLKGDAA